MNKVIVEKVNRIVSVERIDRSVSLEKIKIKSSHHYLHPSQSIDIPKERKGSDDN